MNESQRGQNAHDYADSSVIISRSASDPKEFAQRQWGITSETFADCCESLRDDPTADQWELRDFLGFPRNPSTPVVAAIGLRSEDGEPFQARLTSGPQRLLAPKNAGKRIYRPALSESLRAGIKSRWQQPIEQSPLFITEGPGKALACLERGAYAVCGYGVDGLIERYENLAAVDELEGNLDNGGIQTKSGRAYRRKRGRKLERPQLPARLAALATAKREVYLLPDMDADAEQRYKLGYSWHKLAFLLQGRGCIVKVLSWEPTQGKGIDDYFKNGGTLDEVLETAMTPHAYKLKCEIERPLSEPSQIVNTRELKDAVDLTAIPDKGFLITDSRTGTGKTNFEAEISKGKTLLSATVLKSLMFEQSKRLNATARNNGAKSPLDGTYWESRNVFSDRLVACFAALFLIGVDAQFREGLDIFFLDESSTGLRELATSETLKGRRIKATETFMAAVQKAERIDMMDADITRTEIELVQALKPDAPIYYIQNNHRPEPWPVTWLADQSNAKGAITHFAKELELHLKSNSEGLIHWAADSKNIAKNVQELLSERGIASLCVTSDTPADCELNKALQAQNWGKLKAKGMKVIITSPSVVTGVSWTEQDLFSLVIGTFSGCSITPKQMRQALHRVRPSVPRWVWAASYRARGGSTETHSRAIHRRYERTFSMAKKGLDLDTDFSDAHRYSAHIAARLTADDNRWCSRPAEALQVVLEHDGHQIRPIEIGKISADDYANAAKRRSQRERIELKDAFIIDEKRADELANAAQSGSLTKDERLSYQRYKICEFHAIKPEDLTVGIIEIDEQFGFRSQVRNFEELYSSDGEELASARTAVTLNRAVQDVRRNAIGRRGRLKLELPALVEYLQEGEFTKDDDFLTAFALGCQEFSNAIKDALNLTLTPQMGTVQVVSAMLGQIGLKLKSNRRMVKGKRERYYSLDTCSLALMQETTKRRYDTGTERQALKAYQERLEEQSKDRDYQKAISAEKIRKAEAESEKARQQAKQNADDYWTAEALKGCKDSLTLSNTVRNTHELELRRAWKLLSATEQNRLSLLWNQSTA